MGSKNLLDCSSVIFHLLLLPLHFLGVVPTVGSLLDLEIFAKTFQPKIDLKIIEEDGK